jgi:hypothetical protein
MSNKHLFRADVGDNRCGLVQEAIPEVSWGDGGTPQNVRVVAGLPDFRIGHHRNTKLQALTLDPLTSCRNTILTDHTANGLP